jgi:hypothetical protein
LIDKQRLYSREDSRLAKGGSNKKEGLLQTIAKSPAENRRGPIKLLIEYQYFTKTPD